MSLVSFSTKLLLIINVLTVSLMSVNAANLFGVGWIETECGLREAGPKILCPLVSFRER